MTGTHILAFEGEARVECFEGKFEACEEGKISEVGSERGGAEADQVQEVREVS